MTATALPEWLGRRAYLTPDGPALHFDGETWSFRRLDREARRWARAFAGPLAEAATAFPPPSLAPFGLPRPGPRIALLMENSPDFVAAVHGVAKAGGVLVPLNVRLASEELAWQLADAGAALLVHDEVHREAARAATRGLPRVRRMEGLADGLSGDGDESRRVGLDELHSIVYTSGTTGRPKGALLTYGNYWWNVTGSAFNLGVVPGDRWLAALPLFHVGGLSIVVRSVLYGMPVVLHRRFDPAAVHRAVDEEGVTLLSVVAVMLRRLLDARGDKPYPPTLRAVLVGGGPAPRPLLERAAALGMPVLQTYGMTETASQVTTLAPGDALRKLGAAGKPLFPTRVRLRPFIDAPSAAGSPEGGNADGAPGDVGEIEVAGPTVSPGYWPGGPAGGPPEAAVRRGEWLATGDLGYFDEEGYLYVVDRRDDSFVSGGENVYPAEIEAVLAAHPAVAEAAVAGVPHPDWGQVPAAAVVLRPGQLLEVGDVQQYCRQRLAKYKVPARVAFVSALPRNAAGKVLRRRLRELWEAKP